MRETCTLPVKVRANFAMRQFSDLRLRRSLDYLETRPDIDHNRLAFYGFNWGSIEGSISLALESRFKTAVLADGGCNSGGPLPEVNPINFAPNIKIPVLMINGRYDLMVSFEDCQQAILPSSGHPIRGQASFLLESGHGLPFTPWFKETLDWLDRYLGPCELVPGSHRPLCGVLAERLVVLVKPGNSDLGKPLVRPVRPEKV